MPRPLAMMVCFLLAHGASLAQGEAPSPLDFAALRGLVTTHCLDCHAGDRARGHVDLDLARDADGMRRDVDVWSMAAARLEEGAMPPKSRPKLADVERLAMVTAIRALTAPPAKADAAPGRVILRRLSRREYRNTIRDLCGVDYPAADLFPDDPAMHGLDNIGDVMSLSALHFEKYVDAAAAVAEAALASEAGRKLVLGDFDLAALSDERIRALVSRLIERSFRRPAEVQEIDDRAALVDRKLLAANDAMAFAPVLRSLLVSPHFLFRIERAGSGGERALDGFEIAVRLSYFLWSSMPDQELFDLARSGRLTDPDVVLSQARRLLADQKSRALADGFGSQWLGYGQVLTAAADFRRYPAIWQDHLRPAMYEEAARFFDTVVKEDLPVVRFIDADFSWLNPALAKHYGIAGVDGDGWRKVKFTDGRRGGVLGMGAVLMSTSYPLRTSPVLRGRWILETLLGDPPGPPPPNAGRLPADDKQPDELTLRERLMRHRADPSCAACHDRIDPLGFALENFDVMGTWRDEIHGKPVDVRAELPDGTVVDGPASLRAALAKRSDSLVAELARRLFESAVGRAVESADASFIGDVVRSTRERDHRFSSLVEAIVRSRAFRFVEKEAP